MSITEGRYLRSEGCNSSKGNEVLLQYRCLRVNVRDSSYGLILGLPYLLTYVVRDHIYALTIS